MTETTENGGCKHRDAEKLGGRYCAECGMVRTPGSDDKWCPVLTPGLLTALTESTVKIAIGRFTSRIASSKKAAGTPVAEPPVAEPPGETHPDIDSGGVVTSGDALGPTWHPHPGAQEKFLNTKPDPLPFVPYVGGHHVVEPSMVRKAIDASRKPSEPVVTSTSREAQCPCCRVWAPVGNASYAEIQAMTCAGCGQRWDRGGIEVMYRYDSSGPQHEVGLRIVDPKSFGVTDADVGVCLAPEGFEYIRGAEPVRPEHMQPNSYEDQIRKTAASDAAAKAWTSGDWKLEAQQSIEEVEPCGVCDEVHDPTKPIGDDSCPVVIAQGLCDQINEDRAGLTAKVEALEAWRADPKVREAGASLLRCVHCCEPLSEIADWAAYECPPCKTRRDDDARERIEKADREATRQARLAERTQSDRNKTPSGHCIRCGVASAEPFCNGCVNDEADRQQAESDAGGSS